MGVNKVEAGIAVGGGKGYLTEIVQGEEYRGSKR